MKLFSRTSLVALGTAAAISASALTAPAFAQEANGTADIIAGIELGELAKITATVRTAITPFTVEVAGGEAVSFSAPDLPAGLSISNEGVISGTPTEAFIGTVTIIAVDAAGEEFETTVDLDIAVVGEVLKLEQPALITGNIGKAITTTKIQVTSGEAESFTASGLPAGIFINNDGEIFGTPTKEFSGSATITATDADGKTAKVAVNFNINEEQSNGSSTDNIGDWIKIITAVIGALTTVLTFTSRLDTFMK